MAGDGRGVTDDVGRFAREGRGGLGGARGLVAEDVPAVSEERGGLGGAGGLVADDVQAAIEERGGLGGAGGLSIGAASGARRSGGGCIPEDDGCGAGVDPGMGAEPRPEAAGLFGCRAEVDFLTGRVQEAGGSKDDDSVGRALL
jgi:hypothetical protein